MNITLELMTWLTQCGLVKDSYKQVTLLLGGRVG